MAGEDFLDPEVALAAAATAALFSPPVRTVLRWGLVGGLAGVLRVADVAQTALRVIGDGIDLRSSFQARGLEDIEERPGETDVSGQAVAPLPKADL